MSAFSDSYVSRVLLAKPPPVRGLHAAARRWMRTTLYARPRPEMPRKARARRWALEPTPMKIRHISTACPILPIRSMTETFSSLHADGSACIARGSTSRPRSPVKDSASRKSMTAFGSSASCITISDTSTWSRKPCNLSTTRSARGRHPCLRYDLLPMCPGWTLPKWRARRDSNPRPPDSKSGALSS
jgi:hypothetical protein